MHNKIKDELHGKVQENFPLLCRIALFNERLIGNRFIGIEGFILE